MKIKFKGKIINKTKYYPEMDGKWFYGHYFEDLSGDQLKSFIFNCPTQFEVDPKTVGQYIDTINGQEIYVGDIIRYRKIFRPWETQNGLEYEQTEVKIETFENEVAYDDGFFGILENNEFGHQEVTPFSWLIGEYGMEAIKDILDSNVSDFQEEVDSLCEEFGLADLEELIAYCNVFLVVGNKHNEEV